MPALLAAALVAMSAGVAVAETSPLCPHPHSSVCAMGAEPVTEAQIGDERPANFGAITYVDDNPGRRERRQDPTAIASRSKVNARSRRRADSD